MEKELWEESAAVVEGIAPVSGPESTPEQRYWDRIRVLIEEASTQDELPQFLDAMSYGLGVVATAVPTIVATAVTGEILRRFGLHLRLIAEQQQAAQEAKAWVEAGRKLA